MPVQPFHFQAILILCDGTFKYKNRLKEVPLDRPWSRHYLEMFNPYYDIEGQKKLSKIGIFCG